MRAGEQNTRKEVGQLVRGERKLGMASQITGTEDEELGPKAGRKVHSFITQQILSPRSSFIHYSIDTLTDEPQG